MNLPVDFIKRTRDLLDEEQFAAFCEALSKESPVSIRVNRLKTDAVIIYLPVLRSRSTLCFMPDVIMYKRLLRCFSNKS